MKRAVTALLVCAGLLAFWGCSKGGPKDPNKLGAQYNKLFQSADPQIKGCWDTAMDAMKTNGYAPAVMALRMLVQETNATPEQVQAARETAIAVSDKMYDAVGKGDANAQAAVEELRKATAR